MRYFTLATALAFLAVAATLGVLQHNEQVFFEHAQREQAVFFDQAQARLAREHEEAALASLLAVHEAGHVNLTRAVGNLIWDSEVGPLVDAAQRLPIEPCRALPASSAAGTPSRRDCIAELGRRIRALPEFGRLNDKAHQTMRGTAVFKVKVFDPRGVTVYSSEHAQVGDDARDNEGWVAAAAGRAASELTHRAKFSAFERVVENRDLISSYVPVRRAGSGPVVGVFELYSDVTPFLEQIKAASRRFADISAINHARVEQSGRANQAEVDATSSRFLVIVLGLLALLYAVSLLIVRRGQRIIDRQRREQEAAHRRERQWHHEKMNTLATMSANVSHEVGNPLTVITGVAQDLADQGGAEGTDPQRASRVILEQTTRIAAMMRQIADFTAARELVSEAVDVNERVKAVCDFLRFDLRMRGTPIEFAADPALPPRELVADHLNEIVMSLLQAYVEAAAAQRSGTPIRVRTLQRAGDVVLRVGRTGMATAGDTSAVGARLDAVQRRVGELGWRWSAADGNIEITLGGATAG